MKIALIIFVLLGGLAGAVCYFDHLLFRPLRWMRRARMFVNVIDAALKSGRPVERTLIEMAARGGKWAGIRLPVVTAWLRRGMPLHEALEKVPRMLPEPVQVLLVHGSKMGRLPELLPLARRHLRELAEQGGGPSRTFFGGLVLGTALLGVTGLLFVFVLPKFRALALDMGVSNGPWFDFLMTGREVWLPVHVAVMGAMFLTFEYVTGGMTRITWKQRMSPRLSGLLHGCLPWCRRMFRRRFAMMLAKLLDLGMPDAEAVRVAADFAADRRLRSRADAVQGRLAEGVKLTDALAELRFGPDFEFRIQTAAVSGVPLSDALEEWFETELWRARWRETAAMQLMGVCFTLYNAAIIGGVTIAVFDAEIRLMDGAAAY